MSEYLINNYRKVITNMRVSPESGNLAKVSIKDAVSITVENDNQEGVDTIGYMEFSDNRTFSLPIKPNSASRTIYSSDSIPFAHQSLWIHFADADGNPASGEMIVIVIKLVKITDVPEPKPTVSLEIENSNQYDELEIEVQDQNDQFKNAPVSISKNGEPEESFYLEDAE